MVQTSTITIGSESLRKGNKHKHPYMENGFKGTKEIQETIRKMYEPDKGVKTVFDYR